MSAIPKIHNAKSYILRVRTGIHPIRDFCMNDCEVPKDAVAFSYVNVGKKSDSTFSKEVNAFFNKTGQIIEHVFKTNNIITRKHTYEYPKQGVRIINYFADVGYKISSEVQKIRKKVVNGVEYPVQLLTKRINYLKDKENNPVLEIIFTHFPHIKESKSHSKRVARAVVVERKGQKVLTDFQKSGFNGSFDISKHDKFLLFRLLGLDTDEGLKALTEWFLKTKHIFRLNLLVIPRSLAVAKNSEGEFSVVERKISYSPILNEKSPLHIVNAVAHEVEHAYQYSQIGRLGRGRSSYETEAYRQLGDLKLDEISEATKYAEARFNYPIIKPGEDLSKNQAYLTNYLEVKAREAAKKAEEKYMHSNIQNYLFFDLAYS